MENGKRILYAEVLRVVAAFSVVFQHTASSAWYSLPVDSDKFIFVNVFNSISRFGVGVFFMISGAFLLDPNRNYTPAKILKKKLPQLLLLLIVWGIFFSILNTAIAQGDLKNYLTSPLQIFISPPTHLWFLYVLAGLYALTPALRVFTKNASRKMLLYTIALCFTFGYLLPSVGLLLGKFFHLTLYKNIGIQGLSTFAGFYLTGHYLSTYEIKTNLRKILYGSAIVSLGLTIAGSFYLSYLRHKPDEFFFGNFRPTTFLIAAALFCFVRQVYMGRETQNRTLLTLSKCTLGVYLIHPIFLKAFYGLKLDMTEPHPLFTVPWAACIFFALSTLAVFFLRKVPGLRKVL